MLGHEPSQPVAGPEQHSTAVASAPMEAQRSALTPMPSILPPTPAGHDPGARARVAFALQRSAGNLALQQLLMPVQRCGSEVHDGCACADEPASPPPVQRDGPFGEAKKGFQAVITKASLDSIQAAPMYDLLPKLAAMSAEIRTDEAAGQSSGGPRMVTAMRAVAAKGAPWESFIAANNALLGGLPPEQIGDIVTFLGGPKDAGYYKAEQIKDKTFGGKFDGAVDPVAGTVTLYFRVKFDMDGVRWGPAPMGTPAAEQEAVAGRAKFEADFKKVVESTWSFKGKVKPGLRRRQGACVRHQGGGHGRHRRRAHHVQALLRRGRRAVQRQARRGGSQDDRHRREDPHHAGF